MTAEERVHMLLVGTSAYAYKGAIIAAVREAEQAVKERTIAELERLANQYEKDGEPGPLGYNCWGWQDIAGNIRKAAAAIRALE